MLLFRERTYSVKKRPRTRDGANMTPEDPRREDRVVAFKMVVEDEQPADYYALCSLLTALLAVMFKMQSYCWLTLLFVLASFANTMHSSMDIKAMTANAALVVLVFISTSMHKSADSLIFPSVSRYLRSLWA